MRVELTQDRNLSKPERIRALFDTTLQKISKRMISEKFPDISTSTIEIALSSLLKEGTIIKIGSGRSTAYMRNSDLPDEHMKVMSMSAHKEKRFIHDVYEKIDAAEDQIKDGKTLDAADSLKSLRLI